uniref:Uncharacterized protein n=1 Tax=Cacopsylla melanoneura TaxID=428564 RepID=A0A8D8LQ72_9HEMI
MKIPILSSLVNNYNNWFNNRSHKPFNNDFNNHHLSNLFPTRAVLIKVGLLETKARTKGYLLEIKADLLVTKGVHHLEILEIKDPIKVGLLVINVDLGRTSQIKVPGIIKVDLLQTKVQTKMGRLKVKVQIKVIDRVCLQKRKTALPLISVITEMKSKRKINTITKTQEPNWTIEIKTIETKTTRIRKFEIKISERTEIQETETKTKTSERKIIKKRDIETCEMKMMI